MSSAQISLYYFVFADQYENGSNMIVSIVFRMIQDFLKDHKVLPPLLFLNLDNCGRENKVSRHFIIECAFIQEVFFAY